jgi:flavin-dependent dehydrogenase
VTEVWFDPGDTPYFYWVIPDGPGRAAVGVIGTDGPRALAGLRRFLGARRMRVRELQAGRIPLSPARPRTWGRAGGCDVFLAGDAAGHVKVTTVGGLVTGLVGARAVADSITTGVPYRTTLRPLHRELSRHRFVRRALDRFRATDYDRLLRLMDSRTAALLGTATRDELARTFGRIVWTQPRLLWFARRLVGRTAG